MKIIIDARMYGLEHAGIGRYIINLIQQLQRLDQKNQYFIFLRKKYFENLNFKNKQFKKILADYPHYSFKEQLFLPLQLFKVKPDLIHFPHFNVPILWWGKQVVTIHDLIKHQSRGLKTTTKWPFFYWFKYLNYQFLIWLAVKRAEKIIVPSQWTKKEVIKRFKISAKKIMVTYESADKKFSNRKTSYALSNDKILKKYKIKKPFVIYTGSLYPHKNVSRLIEAIKKVNIDLVVVSGRGVFLERLKKKIKKVQAGKLVVLTGFVSDEILRVLYQEAEAFVLPSLYEGFSLTGLEAMASGLPVVSSQASCLPEIYGQAAVYFDPLSVDDMAEKIKRISSDKKLQQKLVKLGRDQTKKYSWQKMAWKTLGVYNESGIGL